MNNQSFFIDLINKVLTKTQFLTNFDLIDNFIFISILLIFILSTFVTSEVLGILALCIFGLTVINMFIKKGENFEMNLAVF